MPKDKAPETRYSFPESLVVKLGNYLSRRPWAEVDGFMHALNDQGEEVKDRAEENPPPGDQDGGTPKKEA